MQHDSKSLVSTGSGASGERGSHMDGEWCISISLPAGAAEHRVPPPLWDLVALIAHSSAHAGLAHAGAEPARPSPGLALHTPVHEPGFWRDSAVKRDVEELLKHYWGLRFDIDVTPIHGNAPVIVRAPRPGADAAQGGRVLVFAGDIDSIAGMAGEAQSGDVVVVLERSADHDAWSSPTSLIEHLFDARASRLCAASFDDAGARQPPDALGLLRVVMGMAVAASVGSAEVMFFENGIRNLQYPVTAAFLARSRARTVHPGVAARLARLLARMSDSPPALHNPFVMCTPAEVMGVVTGTSDELWAKVRALHSAGMLAQSRDEPAIDRSVATLGALAAAPQQETGYERMLVRALTAPMNENLADAYIHAIRELPELGERELVRRMGALHGLNADIEAPIMDLLQRHARSTRSVLADVVRSHAGALIDGTLPPSCLIARAMAPREPHGEGRRGRQSTFRRRGDRWELWFEGGDWVYLGPLKGIDYLHILLQNPGRIYSAAELASVATGQARVTGASELVTDREALRAYRTRMSDLRDELETANDNNDLGAVERAQDELMALEAEIERCVGLGGRIRTHGDAERARRAVSNAVHRAIGRIRAAHRRLAEHLESSVHIGLYLYYAPPSDMAWLT